MKNAFGLSLWDILTFFTTGVLIFINLLFYNVAPEITGALNALSIQSEIILGVFYTILAYSLGIIFEPFANFSFRFFRRLYIPLPGFGHIRYLREENNRLIAHARAAIRTSLKLNLPQVDPFQVAKSYVVLQGVTTYFMEFLAKFGFYRNLCILFACNFFTAPFIFLEPLGWWKLISLEIAFLIFHLLCFIRSEAFYYYSSNEVLRGFLIASNRQKR